MIRAILHSIKRALTPRAVVLMYHRVAKSPNDPWQLCVSPEHFEQQLQVLTNYNVVPLPAVVNNLPKKGIAITFDDGYIDNYTAARPLLEKYQLPATFFITTGNIDSGSEFWWDELEQVVPDELYLNTWEKLLPLSHERQQQELRRLRLLKSARPEYLSMSSAQLKEMAENPLFHIGAHTVHHAALGHQEPAVQKTQISQSREWLYNLTGKMPELLAYPYGNYNEATINIASEEKLSAAFTTEPRLITKASAPYQRGRFQVKDWDGKEFNERLRSWLKQH